MSSENKCADKLRGYRGILYSIADLPFMRRIKRALFSGKRLIIAF